MKLLRNFTAIFDRTVSIAAVLAAVLIAFTMLSVCAEIVMRYLLNRPTIWVAEVSEYCLLFITFLATAWVLKSEGHVKIELALNRLNPRTKNILNIFTSIIGAIICLTLTWYSVRITLYYFQTGFLYATEMDTPRFIISAIIPIGSFLLSIQFLLRAQSYLAIWRASPKERGL